MSDEEKSKLKDKIIDAIAVLGAIGIGFVSYLVFTNKVPKNIWSYFSYFYIIAFIGVLGVLGEKLGTTLLAFFLPVILAGATLALKFRPVKFPIEDWWEVYSILVLLAAGFLIYMFVRYEQAKANVGSKSKGSTFSEKKARMDPKAAAQFREAQRKLQEKKSDTMNVALKGKGAAKKDKRKAKIEDNETEDERMAREMKQMKDEFSKRSMKLSTILMRIKNLTKSLDRDQIFDNIIEVLAKGMEATRLQLLLNDSDNGKLKIVRATGMKKKDYANYEVPHEEVSMITHVLKSDSTEATGALGIKECEMNPQTSGLAGQGVLKSILVAPIYMEGKVFGVINIEKMKNPDYSRDDQNLLATCADIGGLVMKNAKLFSATMDDLVSAKELSDDQLKHNEQLKSSLCRIVSPSVADMIMKNPDGLKLGGTKCVISTLFTDIRGFTKMSEGMDPTDIVEQLNVYFTKMTDILMELGGTLDKYVGDELMALFGAPILREDDAIRSVLCGIRMLEALEELRIMWKEEGKPDVQIGVGVNTGEVTAGYMGSEKQLSYTVIGDNVNLAARIMSAAKGMEFFITRSTYELVKDYFDITQRESIMVKGKSMAIEIFHVHSVKAGVNMTDVIGVDTGNIVKGIDTPKKSAAKAEEVKADPELSAEDMVLNVKIDDKPKVIECQNCGEENNMQEKFCTKCGMPIF